MISNTTFMKIAYEVAQESKAIKRKVGAVIVKDNNIIAVGYNGTPSGFDNKCEDECCKGVAGAGVYTGHLITRPEVLHAESNAIAKCARSVNSSDGADLYTTTCPCIECAKMIIQAGIKNVFYVEEYKSLDGLNLLVKAGIKVIQLFDFRIKEDKQRMDESIKYWIDAATNDLKVEMPNKDGNVFCKEFLEKLEKQLKNPELYFHDRNKEIENRMRRREKFNNMKIVVDDLIEENNLKSQIAFNTVISSDDIKDTENKIERREKLASFLHPDDLTYLYNRMKNLSKSVDKLNNKQG